MIRLTLIFSLLICLVGHSQENRSISGVNNNVDSPEWGAVSTPLIRKSTPNYLDGMSAMDNVNRPLPREVSNLLFNQDSPFPNTNSLSDFVWLFGQFIDHDISLTGNNNQESQLMAIPDSDNHFDQSDEIVLSRSQHMSESGLDGQPREYANQVTSFLDGSMIYGSDVERAEWLRTFEDGKLWVSKNGPQGSGDLLPWNTTSKEYGGGAFVDNNAPPMEAVDGEKYFVCGDVRANENPLLLALHTLFVREHNRLCDELIAQYPQWTDEQLYQRSRKMIGAYIQAITYNEWLPSMGVHLPDYQGYDSTSEPGIFNVFAAAAFRIGHTMIDSDIIRMDNKGEEIAAGNLNLADGFFKPLEVYNARGIEAYLKGMGTQVMQEMDCKMIDDLRNFLFDGSSRGLDLASINIFRGRDRGLSDFNTLRQDFGLAPIGNFDHITDNIEDVEILKELYGGDINRVDAWVGMLSEQHVNEDAIFGELVMNILLEQFSNLRDNDRFYFENDPGFTPDQIEAISRTTLHDIIMRNTDISLMQPNVFEAMPHEEIPTVELIPQELMTLVYPNPVLDQASIQVYSEGSTEVSYTLFNANGQKLFIGQADLKSGDDNRIIMDMEQYESGIYHLLIESEDNFSISKIIR